MAILNDPIEAYEDPSGKARFYFTHTSDQFTTGVLELDPGGELPRHNRPNGVENLVQLSGSCVMKLFSNDSTPDPEREVALKKNDFLEIPKGKFHIHTNPFEEQSLTFFKLVGDITEIMQTLTKASKRIGLGKK